MILVIPLQQPGFYILIAGKRSQHITSHHLKGVKGVASFARKRPERGKATVPLLRGGLLHAAIPAPGEETTVSFEEDFLVGIRLSRLE